MKRLLEALKDLGYQVGWYTFVVAMFLGQVIIAVAVVSVGYWALTGKHYLEIL